MCKSGEMYIQRLKGLSRRVNTISIIFFFLKRTYNFHSGCFVMEEKHIEEDLQKISYRAGKRARSRQKSESSENSPCWVQCSPFLLFFFFLSPISMAASTVITTVRVMMSTVTVSAMHSSLSTSISRWW